MPIKIHNKEYLTVAERINTFREKHPDWCVTTELVSDDGLLVVVKATIANHERVLSTGYAEEIRGSSMINKTSALENAETSAVGRALAFFGLGGTEIASADEVANAIHAQNSMSGKKVDIDKLTSVVDEAKRLVDEYESDIEGGAIHARFIYKPLNNDERMWVNGQLNAKRTNKGTGKQHAYWAVFKEMLKASVSEIA